MKGKMGMFKLLSILICLLMGLTLLDSVVYAVDEAELKGELEKTYQELKATDPEAAQEFIREYHEAVKSGEITVERADTESGKEIGERGVGEGMMREKYGEREGPRAPDFDLTKPEDRAKALENLDKDSAFLKEKGLSDNDINQLKDAIARGDEDAEIFDKMDKMGLGPPEPGEFEGRGPGDFERYGPPEGMERGPGDFERFGPEGREISKEEMTERFREEMGREPNEFEREMMERGDFERPEFDRPEFERPEFDRPEFDRPEFEREHEYMEPPPPPPPEPQP